MSATSVGQIGLDLVVNRGSFDAQMKGIKGVAKKAGLALAAAFSVKKLTDFSKSCIELGSNLEEVQNVVDVTFQSMSGKIDKFAKSAAGNFGLSETMAKKYAGTFGAMAKSFGFSEKAAYDMSTALTGLAGDVASFYNISQDEAYTKLKSVFTGETETLKELGVVMTQNALDAYAMANGYGKTTQAMSEAEKVSLRFAFVQSQLTAAAGDFARTSGSWANQVRVLTLQFEQFKASIGQGLINVFTPVIQVVNILIGRLVTLANAFSAFTGSFGKFLSSGGKISDTSNKLSNTAQSLAKNISSAGKSATTFGNTASKASKKAGNAAEKAAKKTRTLMGFDQINKLSDNSSVKSPGSSGGGGGGSGGSGIGATAPDVPSVTGDNEKKIKPLPKIYHNLAKSILRFKAACNDLGNVLKAGLKWGYENVLKPLGKWTISKFLPKLIDVFSAAIRVLTSVIKALAPLGKWLWEKFLSKLAKFAGDAIIGFLSLLEKGLNKLSAWINKHQTAVQNIAIAIGSFFVAFKAVSLVTKAISVISKISGAFSAFFKVVKFLGGPLKAITSIFKNLPLIISCIASPVGIAVVAVGALITAGVLLYKNWDKVKKFAKTAWDKVSTIVKSAVSSIVKMLNKIIGFIKNNWKQLLLLLVNPFAGGFALLYKHNKKFRKSVDKFVKSIIKKVGEIAKGIAKKTSEIIKNVKSIPDKVKKLFKGKIDGVEEWFNGIKEAFTNALSNLGDSIPDLSDIKDAISEKIGEVKASIEIPLSLIKNGWTTINEFVGDKVDVLVSRVKNWKESFNDWIQAKADAVISRVKNWKESFDEWIHAKADAVISRVKNWKNSFDKWIGARANALISRVKNWRDSFKKWMFGNNDGKISALIERVKKWKSTFKEWISGNKKGIISVGISLFKSGWKSLSDWIGKMVKVGVNIFKKATGGVYKNGRWSPVQQFASGGKPNMGQMFIAREAGPELVGTLGGHTAVMNNDQIVASVASGVAKATSASMIKVAQSLYSAISSLKVNTNIPQAVANAAPKLKNIGTAGNDTVSASDVLEIIRGTKPVNKDDEIIALLKEIIALLGNLGGPIYLDGKLITDVVVKRINAQSRATGKPVIII